MAERFRCKQCGKGDTFNYMACRVRTIMEERMWCFECGHWQEFTEHMELSKRNVHIVDHVAYTRVHCNPMTRPSNRGHGGARFYFQCIETKEIFTSNNVWSQGRLPEHWWDRIPDNSVMISPMHYEFVKAIEKAYAC